MDKVQQIASDLRKYFANQGITQIEIARRLGKSKAQINAYMTGRSPFGKKQAEEWGKEFNIPSSWLLTGDGPMLREVEEKYEVEEMEDSIDVTTVPLIPTPALANSISEFVGGGLHRRDCRNIISPVPGADIAITISGDSMEPKFQDGMVVYLKRINDSAFIPWGNTLVLDTENGAFIKNVFPCSDDENYIEARSINTFYPPMRIPKSSIFALYRVLSSTKFFTTM